MASARHLRSFRTPALALLFGFASEGAAAAQVFGRLHDMIAPHGGSGNTLAVGDLDGDGDLDLYKGSGLDAVLLWEPETGYRKLPGAATGGNDRDVALGDVDGDGHLDLLGTQGKSNIHLNDGTGMFALATGLLPPSSDSTHAVALGDLDQDGDLDIVLGNDVSLPITTGQERVLLLQGGVYVAQPQTPFVAKDRTTRVALADLDANGALDIVVANGYFAEQVNRLYLNAGGAVFGESVGAFGTEADMTLGVSVADFEGDGDLDVAFGNDDNAGAAIDHLYLNDGAASFAVRDLPGLHRTADLALADVDGDGDQDVLVLTHFDQDTHHLYLNNGGAAFIDASHQFTLSPDWTSYEIEAFDADGDSDVDVVLGVEGTPELYLNDGSGHFVDSSAQMTSHRVSSEVVALSDVDGDGDLDLYEGNQPTVSISGDDRLLLNTGAGIFVDASERLPDLPAEHVLDAAFGDWDGDGDSDLLLAVDGVNSAYRNDGAGTFTHTPTDTPASAAESHGVAVGDLDGDGDVDAVIGNDDAATQLLANDGGGAFLAGAELDPLDARQVGLGDLDADGDLDLVRGFFASKVPDAFLNDGAGALAPAPVLPAKANAAYDLALFDADGDGDDDILLARSGQNELALSNLPAGFIDGTAGVPQTPGSSPLVTCLAVLDLDGDQDLDVVGGASGAPTNLAHINQGNGTFIDASTAYFAPDYEDTVSIAVGDLDRDNAPDLVFGNDDRQDNSVRYHLGHQVAWRALPRLGKPLAFDVYGGSGGPWFLALSQGPASIPLAPFGTLLLDPATLLLVASGLLDGAGHGSVTVPVPANPTFLGLETYWQAALGPSLTLSNLEIAVLTGQ